VSTPVERTLAERLDAVRTAVQRDATRSPEAARAVLDTRARRLARRLTIEEDTGQNALDLLHVQIESEQLAIPLTGIVAIARAGAITPLPRAVAPVFGVTSWRGRPLTVLSLASTAPTITADSRLVVLGTGSRAALAITVDAVHDVGSIALATLVPAGPGPRRSFALGIAPGGVLVVDGNALLELNRRST
jgi:chemotaxis signal transduction protein